jgi:hypothetical protein
MWDGEGMMTIVGHTLFGISIGFACLPEGWAWKRRAVYMTLVGHAASFPDLPFPYWGHFRYHISHSIFTNAIALAAVLLLLSRLPQTKEWFKGIPRVGFALAWYSHFLLDSFYNHGKGVGIFWPVSEAHLTLPISIFQTLPGPKPDPIALRIFAIEAVVYGSILAVVLCVRFVHRKRAAALG